MFIWWNKMFYTSFPIYSVFKFVVVSRPLKGSPLCSMSCIAMVMNYLIPALSSKRTKPNRKYMHLNTDHQTIVKFSCTHSFHVQVCLPRRDCSEPSSVDAISLSLSKPRPLSIHDWAVFSKTYNLHCICRTSADKQRTVSHPDTCI